MFGVNVEACVLIGVWPCKAEFAFLSVQLCLQAPRVSVSTCLCGYRCSL